MPNDQLPDQISMTMEQEDAWLDVTFGQQTLTPEEGDEAPHGLQNHPLTQQTDGMDKSGTSTDCVTAVIRSALCLLGT